MTSVIDLGCCPCCKVDVCLSGDTIDTGCCLACDDLIMWSERPAFSITQRFYAKAQPTCYPGNISICSNSAEIEALGQIYNCTPTKCSDECDPACFELSECPSAGCDGASPGPGKILNYTVSAEELEPVQTVYRFHETYWRPVGLFSGPYPVHSRNNANPNGFVTNGHRTALSKELPIIQDPNKDGEVITGKLARCRYEVIDETAESKMYHWVSTSRGQLNTCLGFESPCSKSNCNNITGSACTPEETSFCGSFILDPSHIVQDLKRGYPFSSEVNSGRDCCYPVCADSSCTSVTDPPLCECDSYWLTKYRRRKLLDNFRYNWGVDIECYNDSNQNRSENTFVVQNPGIRNYFQEYDLLMGPPIDLANPTLPHPSQSSNRSFRLADHWLFNMHFERWWKVGQNSTDGKTQSFWNIPGTSGSQPNPTQTTPPNPDPYPYLVSNLIPKWWIYACSGVPVFQFEIEDAVQPMNILTTVESEKRQPAITGDQYQRFIDARNNQTFYSEYHLQDVWNSLSNAGYFQAKDWRQEQLQVYKDLDARFPNSGYAVYANKTVDQMPELGPYRKRYYPNHEIATALNMRKPYLRPNLVPKSSLHLQSECFIPYPGDFPTLSMTQQQRDKAISDYYYWAERQWVYFRGVPAGWTWASWNAQSICPCCPGPDDCCVGPAPSEEAAILAGCGRASGNCIESWFNQPQISYTKNNLENNTCIKTGGSGPVGVCKNNPLEGNDCQCCQFDCAFAHDANSPEYAACIAACNVFGLCKEIIPVTQCLVPETTSGNTNGGSGSAPQTTGTQNTDFCGCAATPVLGCPQDICSKVSVTGYCGGVHIIAVQYATENKMEVYNTCFDPNDTVNSYYRCLWTANTFLTPARNLYEYNQKKCTGSSNTDMFSYWPDVKNTHVVPKQSICNNHIMAISGGCVPKNTEQYKVVPACESGICWPWYVDTVGCEIGGCLVRMPCVSLQHGKQWDGRNVCPPSCGTDSPSYGSYQPTGYFGKDGDTGSATESSCERNAFIGYEPICDMMGRTVDN